MASQVPLCKVCNSGDADAGNNSKVSREQSKTRKKKRKNGRWDDESEEDEPDLPEYPPGIMKVFLPPPPPHGTANVPPLVSRVA